MSVAHPRKQLQVTFTSFDVCLRVRTNESDLLELLVEHLPPGWKPTNSRPDHTFAVETHGSSRKRYAMFRDEDLLFRTSSLKKMGDALQANVHHYIAEMSPDRIFLHAGVVAWKDRAIVIPGQSNSGKTTLVRALLLAGATYYSDEYAVLDESGRVHPFARPLAVRRTRWGIQKKRVEPESLGAKIGKEPLPIGLVVISSFDENGRWQPRRLTASSAALEILAHSVAARSRPQDVLAFVGKVVTHGATVKSERGGARQTARLILDYLDQI